METKEIVINVGPIYGKIKGKKYLNSFLSDKIIKDLTKGRKNKKITRNDPRIIKMFKSYSTKSIEKEFPNGDRPELIVRKYTNKYILERDDFNRETLIEYNLPNKFKPTWFKKLYYIDAVGKYKFKSKKYYKLKDLLSITNKIQDINIDGEIVIKKVNFFQGLFNSPDYNRVLYDKWVLRNLKSISHENLTTKQKTGALEYIDTPYKEIPTRTLLLTKDLELKIY